MDHEKDNIFQVSVKGLCFNESGKLLMIREQSGYWELPGGRIQVNEDLIEALKRECLEETGLNCELLDNRPFCVWPALDTNKKPRFYVCYKISFDNLDFKPSEECVEMKFFTKSEFAQLHTPPALQKLLEFI